MKRPDGAVVTGAAHVLSLRQWRSLSVNTAVPRTVCRIRLRVDVPGRATYDVTVWRNLDPWDVGAVEPGRTVAVEVDAAKPKRVRIDLSQPPPRPTRRAVRDSDVTPPRKELL